MHPVLQRLEVRPAGVAQGDDLAVEQRVPPAHGRGQAAQFRVGGGNVLAGPGDQPHPAALAVGQRAHPVPLHLQRPLPVVGRQVRLGAGQHGRQHPGQRLPLPVHHPVGPTGLEQRVAAGQPATVQHHLDLAAGPLDRLEGAAVPDRDRARAVLAVRDAPGEPGVLQRMVLGVHGEVVHRGVVGHPLGHRPRDQHAVAFQPEVPVQPAGVVLLHHEHPGPLVPRCQAAGPGRIGRLGRVRHRLGRAPPVPFVPVGAQGVHAQGLPRMWPRATRCAPSAWWIGRRGATRTPRRGGRCRWSPLTITVEADRQLRSC